GHGASDAPHDPDRYGDDRLVADLVGVTERFGGDQPVIAGYSMGAAITLLALSRGLRVGGACVAGAPRAVFGWTQADEDQRAVAVDALEGPGPPSEPMMQVWIAFLDATGSDKLALAALLRRHQPVIERWDRIVAPVVVGAGINDATAAAGD